MGETPLTPAQVLQAQINAAHHNYVQRILTGVDDLGNVLSGGNLDETISARVGRLAAQGNELARFIRFGLDLIQRNHCELAEAGDLARAKAIEQVEQESLGSA
jgi:hypothetical protein